MQFKIELKDTQSITNTLENMMNTGLPLCKFNELINIVSALIEKYPNKEKNNYFEACLKKIKTVQKGEPEFMISGLSGKSLNLSQPISGDLVYFPEAFENTEVYFESQLSLIDHATLECSFKLLVPEINNYITPYESDSWKIFRPNETKLNIKNATPNLIVFLTENEHIPINYIQVMDKRGNPVEFEFKIVFTEFHIPDSYHRFGYVFGETHEIPECKRFKYFRGRAGVLEWRITPDEEYKIFLTIKNYQSITVANEQISFTSGFLCPFKKTKHSVMLRHTNKVQIESFRTNEIKYFEDRDRPCTISLLTEPNSISEKQFSDSHVVGIDSEKRQYNISSSNLELDYSVFGLFLKFRVAKESLSIATLEWEQPIPTALSRLLLDKIYSFPPLCQYDIINNSKEDVNLLIKTEIEEFTTKQEETVTILPYSTKRINHTPLFKQDIIKLTETCEANLKLSVACSNSSILQKTIRTNLLAFDTMIFEIINPINRIIFYLYDFLAVWVTPHDQEVEKVIAIAKEYHKDTTLEGYSAGLPDEKIAQSTYLQVEAIFMALKEFGISYVDASLSFGWDKPYAFQRIKLPSISLKTKAANCIDGTVLFASLLEHVGLDPFLIIVPGHAFVGWKSSPNSNKPTLLETTQISSATFEQAIKYGQISLGHGLEDARRILNNPNLTLNEAINSGIIRIIDIASMRKKRILPQNMFY